MYSNHYKIQDVKHNINSLILLNVPIDFYKLSIHVLNRLGPTYSNLSHALQVRENPFTFEELFKHLLNYEAPTPTFGSSPPFQRLPWLLYLVPRPIVGQTTMEAATPTNFYSPGHHLIGHSQYLGHATLMSPRH